MENKSHQFAKSGQGKKQAYYSVIRGRFVGVFWDWPSCEAQVKGYVGAIYKKYDTAEEACKSIEVGLERLKHVDAALARGSAWARVDAKVAKYVLYGESQEEAKSKEASHVPKALSAEEAAIIQRSSQPPLPSANSSVDEEDAILSYILEQSKIDK